NATIDSNIICGGYTGIHFGGVNTSIKNNTISNCTNWSIMIRPLAKDVLIEYNDIENIFKSSIYLNQTDAAIVKNNNLKYNGIPRPYPWAVWKYIIEGGFDNNNISDNILIDFIFQSN